MKKIWIAVAAVCLVLAGCSQTPQTASRPAEAHAEFPRYDFATLIQGKTDLVVLAKVTSTTEVKENDPQNPDASHQEATLQVVDKLYGNESSPTIKLYQSVDRVKKGQTYLLFLSYRSSIGQYVVSDGNSQIEVNNNRVKVGTKGIEGEYTIDQFKGMFGQKLKEVKNPH